MSDTPWVPAAHYDQVGSSYDFDATVIAKDGAADVPPSCR